MKTAVSIPDAVFNQAEGLARLLGISRSKLYTRALDKFLSSNSSDSITDAMNAAIDAAGSGSDPFAEAGARRVFERSEW